MRNSVFKNLLLNNFNSVSGIIFFIIIFFSLNYIIFHFLCNSFFQESMVAKYFDHVIRINTILAIIVTFFTVFFTGLQSGRENQIEFDRAINQFNFLLSLVLYPLTVTALYMLFKKRIQAKFVINNSTITREEQFKKIMTEHEVKRKLEKDALKLWNKKPKKKN